MQRRDFLKTMTTLAVAWTFKVHGAQVGPALPDAFDEIDHFQVGHRIRDGYQYPAPAPSIFKEVVVVGGGISGLVTLYRLRDRNCLLLEKEAETGGNSRRRRAHGIYYPLGALLSEGPVAPFTGFFTELGIDFVPVTSPRLAYACAGTIIPEPLEAGSEQLPFSSSERQTFVRAAQALKAYLDPKDGIFFPLAGNLPTVRRLDEMTLNDYFEAQGFTPELRHFLDLLVSSRLGDGGQATSAWIGLYLLSRLLAPAYTLPGGHGAISERLTARTLADCPKGIMTGVTATRVEDRGDRVWVSAVDAQGEPFTVEARCAVMATPKMLTKHLVRGLAQARPGLYDAFHYNAYLVAQVELKAPVSPAFEVVTRDLFTRFVVAPDRLPDNHGEDGRSHLTIYIPYPGIPGRVALYSAEARDLAQRIVTDLVKLFPPSQDLIDSIRLHRWGHPMISPQPRLSNVLEQVREPFGNVIFAHSDTFGITGLYSAIWTGMDAHSETLLRLLDS